MAKTFFNSIAEVSASFIIKNKLTIFICTSFFVSVFSVLFAEAKFAILISSVALTGCGVLSLASLLSRPMDASIYEIYAGVVCLAYGGGTLNTVIRYAGRGIDVIDTLYASRAYISYAMAYVGFFVMLLCLLGKIDSCRPFSRIFIPQDMVFKVIFGSIFIGVLFIFLMLFGQIGFQLDLSFSSDGAGVSPVSAIVIAAVPPFAALSAYCLPMVKGRQKLAAITGILFLLIPLVTQGRRFLIFTGVLCISSYFCNRASKKFSAVGIVVGVVFAALFGSFGSKLFYSMRLAQWDLGPGASLVQIVPAGIGNLMDSDLINLDDQIEENLLDRGMVLAYFAEIIQRLDVGRSADGEILRRALALSVPSVIWSGKDEYKNVAFEEDISHPYLGLPIWDAANSIITSGVSDAGFMGGFVYGLFYLIIYSVIIRFSVVFSAPVYSVVALSLVYGLLSIEASLAAVFSTIRSAVISGILVQVFFILPKFNLKK